MEMLSSFRGDKHEFCLVVIEIKHSSLFVLVDLPASRNSAGTPLGY